MRIIKEIEFEKVVKEAKGLVLVDFFTEWCGYCELLVPELESAEKEVEGLTIVKVNAEEAPNLMDEYNIEFFPLILLFKDGKLVDHIDGYVKKDVIIKKVKEYM